MKDKHNESIMKDSEKENDIIEAIKKKQEVAQNDNESEQEDKFGFMDGLEGMDLNMIKEQAEQAAKAITEKIAKAEEEVLEYRTIAQRVQAEFDNYRKRNALAVFEAREEGQIDVIISILPIIDNFERALASLQGKVDEKNYEGIEMIYKLCLSVLESNNIEEIEALGEKFDPSIHNAAMQSPIQDGQSEDEIIGVFQKGYKKGDKIIRHCMVNVAK